MKREELRVGNHVYGVSDRIEQINEIHSAYVETSFRGGLLHYSKYEDITPVELTNELLQRCGFNYSRPSSTVLMLNISDAGEDYHCTLQVSGSGIQICRSGIGAICPPIFHLHELQNLYFMLTKKELTINK